jgi:hypothetical protein
MKILLRSPAPVRRVIYRLNVLLNNLLTGSIIKVVLFSVRYGGGDMDV